jgi:hypothetical protein
MIAVGGVADGDYVLARQSSVESATESPRSADRLFDSSRLSNVGLELPDAGCCLAELSRRGIN